MEKNKKLKWMIIITAIVAAGLIVAVLAVSNSPSHRLSKALDLGHRYLESGEYEQAIASFEEALTIDPKSVDAYLGEADAYVALEDYENVIAVLEKGYEETGDSQIKNKLDEIRKESPSITGQQIDDKDMKADDLIAQETAEENASVKNGEKGLYTGIKEAGNFIIWDKPFSEWTYDTLKELFETNGRFIDAMDRVILYQYDGGVAHISDPHLVFERDDIRIDASQNIFTRVTIVNAEEKIGITPVLGLSLTEFLKENGAEELQNEIEQANDREPLCFSNGEGSLIVRGSGDNLTLELHGYDNESVYIMFDKSQNGEWIATSIECMSLR